MNTLTNSTGSIAHWLLRIAIASVFLYHGYNKLFDMGVGTFGEMMGLSPAIAWLAVLGELAAGILIIVGGFGLGQKFDLATRASGALVIAIMVGAIQKAHWGRWSFAPTEDFQMGGMEFQTVLILIGLFVLLLGNGINNIRANN